MVITLERRRSKMPPTPYQMPKGGNVLYYMDENSPAIHIPNYLFILSKLNPKLLTLKIRTESQGIVDDVPGVPDIHITKRDIKEKLIYWHVEPSVLFFTHRALGRIQITYTDAAWQFISPDLGMNFDVLGIPTPLSDSSSSDNEAPEAISIPGPEAFPFYKSV